MGESQSFIIGATGIGVSFFVVIMGWLPSYILFGSFILAAVLYGSKFFATGIAGGFGAGVFSALGWIPNWIYFTVVVIATVFLATRVAAKYINIGEASK